MRLMAKTLTVLLALILLAAGLPGHDSAFPAAAAPEAAKWERVNLPAGGETGNWTLAAGSDVKYLTMAKEGTLYAYANPTGTSCTLFKSVDGGYSWSACGNVQDTIAGIAVAQDDASVIYYATAVSVYKSADAGKSFSPLPAGPGGAGTGNTAITSLAVGRLNGKSLVAVGTTDGDSSQYGGVYTLDESKLMPAWQNTNLGNFDVSAVAFSPNFASDRQLLAVATNEVDTIVANRIGDGVWNQVFGRTTIPGRAARGATIAFPDDFEVTSGDYTFFVALDTGSNNGDVFKIRSKGAPGSSVFTDLSIGANYNLSNVDVTGLAVSGNGPTAVLLAGAAGSTHVYISKDGGVNWTRDNKQPTGQSKTYLRMTADFATSGIAYAATSGIDSAFSYTTDGGVTWNQVGMIDSRISSNGIIDIAVSPDYSRDNTLFMLTFDAVSLKHSLWRSHNGGTKWERAFAGSLPNVDTLSMVEVSPQYGAGTHGVFLAGTSNGLPAMWKSADDGQTFTCRVAPAAIDAWLAVDDNSLFLGSYNGTSGLVYSTGNSGFFYSDAVAAGSLPLKSSATSPNYNKDQTLLVGNSNGWVYYSSDNGTSFKPLPLDATSPPLSGSIFVAFDAEFESNHTVYAASNQASKGIYRFVIGKSTRWERVDTTLPAGGTLNQLIVSADGTLYAANTQSTNSTASKGGIERSLDPAYSLGPTFETVTRGLDDGINLGGLWLQGNQLWSIDTANTRVMTFIDSLSRPVTIASPSDGATATGTSNIILKWAALSGATEYKWQLDYDTDFSSVPSGFEGTTQASSVRLPALDADTTYYWRVRATKPVLSRWSTGASFTTGLGTAVVVPELYSPKAGAEGVSLKPLFQWSAIVGASNYELMVAADVFFAKPVITKTADAALPATAWQSDINLEHDTTYYWKVRASGSGSYSAWSAVSAFITQPPSASPAPAVVPTQVAPTSPSQPPPTQPSSPVLLPTQPPAQAGLPDWFPYVMGGLLTAVVILIVAVLVLVVAVRRR